MIPSCDTIVALAPATRAGATILAKNSDRPPLECQPLFQAPARRHPEGATVHCQYIEIPQVPETCGVIGSRPYWLWGFEHGINDHGVAIGNEAVLTREPLPAIGLLGMDLVRLGLERGRTAREAVEVIGALIERHGQGGSAAFDFDFRYSGGFIVADHSDAYVVESSAHRWVAVRVTDRACISNRLSIADYEIGSPDAKRHAREQGWWNGDEPFDFARIYAMVGVDDPLSARARLSRTTDLVARGGKRTIREVMAILRDHYEQGETPIITAPPASEKSFSVCMHNIQGTTASMIAELTAPGSGRAVTMWSSLAAPCTSMFFPLYTDASIPPALAAGAINPSPQSPWWRMKQIQDAIARDPSRLAPIAWEHFRPLENAIIERAAEVGRRASTLAEAERARLLSIFMTQNFVRMMRQAGKVEAALARA